MLTENNTLVTIMAHAGGQEIFDRHLPLWEAHRTDLLVYCPKNAIVNTRHSLLAWGDACHHSTHANERFIHLLKFLSRLDYEAHFIFEYDAICLDPNLENYHGLLTMGNVFRDDRPDRGFKGTTFIHPPLRISRAAMVEIVYGLSKYPPELEQGFWDRWLGLACEEYGYRAWGALGFSHNTIQPEHYESARQSVENGAVMLHGIKSAECLRVVTDAYRKRPMVSQV